MISAKIIADSISVAGHRITTFELEYPRFIHAEFMTHRLFSRNAASSRAIPVKRAIELIQENTAMPIHWGKNQPGMSAKEECDDLVVFNHVEIEYNGNTGSPAYEREEAWNESRDRAIEIAKSFDEAGYHKQIVNRLLEPYSHIKVVCTSTEFDNFFYLRRHPDAQPEIQELANQMWSAYQNSIPYELSEGEWHVPYFRDGYWAPSTSDNAYDDFAPDDAEKKGYSLEDAIAISASCCAQVSYRRLDDSLEKAKQIYQRLIESKPAHASPFEHQATPMDYILMGDDCYHWEGSWMPGITHADRFGDGWSGNFRGWIQNRQLIPDNVCVEYIP
jgi:thymidylate synthase ThyX